MRVAILTDTLAHGLGIHRNLGDAYALTAWVVLCPTGKQDILWRVSREIWNWLKNPCRAVNLFRFLSLLLTDRLVLLRHQLQHAISVERLRSLNCDVGLHNAYVIYRKPTIESFRLGILNAHIGFLPEFRGRSVMEWSILKGAPTGVTVFFIDEGIDTGPRIVFRRKLSLAGFSKIEAAKTHLFQQDASLYREALEELNRPDFTFEHNGAGHRYYPMSNLFLSVAENLLRGMKREPGASDVGTSGRLQCSDGGHGTFPFTCGEHVPDRESKF